MFGGLTEKLQGLFSGLGRQKRLTEENMSDAVRQVRLALLDADVHFDVVKAFIAKVKERALGGEVLKAISPSDQFIKIVHDELVSLMGGDEAKLDLSGSPAVILLCGLQGAGKTTQAAKLAAYLKKKGQNRKPMLIACDLERPAAIKQLHTLGAQIEVPVFSMEGEKRATKVVTKGVEEAKRLGCDVVIVDTAGRLHIDEDLMKELIDIKKAILPAEVLFVAKATEGQDAVTTAMTFDERMGITGVMMTMLDGNARAGAALSIREVIKKPIKFEGIGEKIDDLQLFNPHSLADRILGMGDVINLVKKAEEQMDDESSEDLEHKVKTASFTFDDYLHHMGKLKKMGPLKALLKMMPGMNALDDLDLSEKEFKRTEAIILSMTKKERLGREELSPSRRRRIAKGSGTDISDVDRLVKGLKKLKQFMKSIPEMKNDKVLKGMAEKFGFGNI